MLKTKPFMFSCLLSGALVAGAPAAIAGEAPATETVDDRPSLSPRLEQPIAQRSPRSEVILRLEDLPDGFQPMPQSELAALKQELSQDDFQVENVFAFMEQQQFELIMGITTTIADPQERSQFDAALSQPQLLRELLTQGLDDTEVLDERPLTGLQNIGDVAAGVSMKVNLEDIPARLEILAFRNADLGAFVFVMYLDGAQPVVPIADVARILDRRARQAGSGRR
jgi:hypothetical protein